MDIRTVQIFNSSWNIKLMLTQVLWWWRKPTISCCSCICAIFLVYFWSTCFSSPTTPSQRSLKAFLSLISWQKRAYLKLGQKEEERVLIFFKQAAAAFKSCAPTWSMKVRCLWMVASYCSFWSWKFLFSSFSVSFTCLTVSSLCWAWRKGDKEERHTWALCSSIQQLLFSLYTKICVHLPTSAACSMLTVRFFSSSSSLILIMEPVISAAVADAWSTPVSSSSDKTAWEYKNLQVRFLSFVNNHDIFTLTA